MITANKNKTLYEILFHQSTIMLDVFMILASVVFMAAMANITIPASYIAAMEKMFHIPLWPVPITMQTFGVFIVTFFFGSRKGLIAMAAYALAGLLGFGVFAGHKSGVDVFLKASEGFKLAPSGGYIIGFLLMAFLVGIMIEKGYGRTGKSILLCMLVGEIVLYTIGLPWLWIALGKISWLQVLKFGLVPFIIGDTLKALLAAALFPYMWKGAEKIGK